MIERKHAETSDGEQQPSAEVEVFVNGEKMKMSSAASVSDVLTRLRRDPLVVAVELNGVIVPRNAYTTTRLGAADRFEIVQFVQGG